jgi:hypothetical protein
MMRKAILMAAVLLLVMTGVASARPGAVNLLALQDEDTGEIPADAPAPVTMVLGERYSNVLFDLEIQDAFSVDSPIYPGYDEVRLSVAFRQNTGVPWLQSSNSFSGEYGYPVLQLIDGAGVVYDLPSNVVPVLVDVIDEETDETTTLQVGDVSYQVSGSALSMQPSGIPARWTVGYRVPSSANDDLVVRAVFGGVTLAEWDLESDPIPTAGWERPEGFDFAELGDQITWSEALVVEPKAVATAVCADSQFGHVSVDSSLLIGVSSVVDQDSLWPDVRYPDVPGIVVWHDGTTAQYRADSTAFYEDDTEEQLFDRFLLPFGEHVIVPPQTDQDRFMEFMAPRDSRFSDVTGNPVALVLYPPNGPAVWVDLEGEPTGAIDDFECAVPTFHLFAVDRLGTAPVPPAPEVESPTILDA